MHSSAVLNNLLYACGGLITGGVNDTNLCETLAVSTCGTSCVASSVNWITATAMPSNCWDHAAVVLNSRMYIIGGSTGQTPSLTTLATVTSFDPATNTWSSETSMSTRRKGPGAVALQGNIYVCGNTV